MANAEQFGILSIVTALAVRFLFYEDWEENYRIRKTYMEELERASEMSESDSVSVDTYTSERYLINIKKVVVRHSSPQCRRPRSASQSA